MMAKRAKPQYMREGYWHSEDEPMLPKPRARKTPWKGKERFLKALAKVTALSNPSHQKGSSTCRCCGQSNGSADVRYDGWAWPSGFAHYVKEHNVRPSLAFEEFVIGKYLGEYR